MLKLLTAIFVGLFLVGGSAGTAHSGDVTFKLTNKASYIIMVKFYSQSRGWVWPSSTQHYVLDDTAQHDFKLACDTGEKVCYGGSYTAEDRTFWGVGFKGDKGCTGCCLVCGTNVSYAWNLTE